MYPVIFFCLCHAIFLKKTYIICYNDVNAVFNFVQSNRSTTMSWGIESQKKREDILYLMELSTQKMMENPNHVNEVKKSENGCWMDQMYGMQRCDICDLDQNCPGKLEKLWQDYCEANNIIVDTDSDDNS